MPQNQKVYGKSDRVQVALCDNCADVYISGIPLKTLAYIIHFTGSSRQIVKNKVLKYLKKLELQIFAVKYDLMTGEEKKK
jgi:hypothetical protein